MENILPEIDPEETFHFLGYNKENIPSGAIRKIVESTIEKVMNSARIVAGYDIIRNFEIEAGRLHTGRASIESAHMARIASSAKEMLIGLLALQEPEESGKNNITQEFLEHELKSYAVERGQKELMQIISRSRYKYMSLPFSPGYCDWDLSGQELVMRYLDPEALGVHIHPNTYSMLPVYSISFASFLGNEKMENNPCKYCNMRNFCHHSR